MEYRITRLLEPRLETAAPSSASAPPTVRRRLAAWVGLAVLALVPALLSGSRGGVAPVAPPDTPATEVERADVPLNEWIRLVGASEAAAPDVEDVPPPIPNWGIRQPDTGASTGAQALLAGDAEGLAIGALPVDLGRLLRQYGDATRQIEMARDGGEVQLVGGNLPPWMWAEAAAVRAPRRAPVLVTLPPTLDGRARIMGLEALVDGVDYSDPTGVGHPLLRAAGYEDYRVSTHFTVRDFQTKDEAPYMRVASGLVAGLESMRTLVGPLEVISGYRHPHYNRRRDVGGARYSRHQSGEAADIWSETKSTIDLARAAIQAMGCGIGLGLGENTIHVDVRGYLSTWTYPGAPLSRRTFDAWILNLCGGSAPLAPPATGRLSQDILLALAAEELEDEAEVVHSDAQAIEAAVEEATEAPAPPPLSVDALVHRDLVGFARDSYRHEGLGAVVVDLRDGQRREGDALRAVARYALVASPELRAWGVRPLFDLVRQRSFGTFFVYVILEPDGRVLSGIAPMAPASAPVRHEALLDVHDAPAPPQAPAPSSSPAPSSAPPEANRAPEPAAAAPAQSWVVLFGSSATIEEARREVAGYRASLAAARLPVSLHIDGRSGTARYRVAVGAFESEAAAREARLQVQRLTSGEGEVVRLR